MLLANWQAGTGEWAGGAIFAAGATVNLTLCSLTGNKAEENGGAIYAKKLDGVASTVTIKGGVIGGANATAANKATVSAVYAGKGAAFMWARTAP